MKLRPIANCGECPLSGKPFVSRRGGVEWVHCVMWGRSGVIGHEPVRAKSDYCSLGSKFRDDLRRKFLAFEKGAGDGEG